MSEITKGEHKPKAASDHLTHDDTGTKNGVPAGATQEESHAGYGGSDRLATETALHPDAGKDQAKDI